MIGAVAILLTVAGVAVLVGFIRHCWLDRDRYRPRPPLPPVRVPVRRAVRADVPHALYHYPHAYRPGRRYIGVSNEPPARHRRHETDPTDRWWFETSTGQMVIVRWYPSRRAAFAAERAAVRQAALAGEDIANDHHNPVRRRPAATNGRPRRVTGR